MSTCRTGFKPSIYRQRTSMDRAPNPRQQKDWNVMDIGKFMAALIKIIKDSTSLHNIP